MKASIPNLLTIARIGAVPLLVLLYCTPYAVGYWGCVIVYVLAALSDWLDGVLARRWGVESEMGRVLDPISDKLLVGIMLMLLISDNTAQLLPAVAILFRELLISGLREGMAHRDFVIHVSPLAKWKTASQMVSVGLLLLAHGSEGPLWYWLGNAVLWLSAALTLYTGWEYVRAAWENLRNPINRH